MDAKTKTLLDEYRSKKKETDKTEEKEDSDKNGDDTNGDKKEDGEVTSKDEKSDELDEFTKREDRVAKAGLDAIMREYAFELAKEPANKKPSMGRFWIFMAFIENM